MTLSGYLAVEIKVDGSGDVFFFCTRFLQIQNAASFTETEQVVL